MAWPWIDALGWFDLSLAPYPQLQRWHAEIAARPAVRRSKRVSHRPVGASNEGTAAGTGGGASPSPAGG